MRIPPALLLVALLLAPGASAQEATDREVDRPGGPAELRTAMQRYFQKRLRAELALSDAQFEEIVPRIRRMEESKRMAQRARMEGLHRLRRGLEQGASDAELQEALDRVERAQRDHWQLERTMLGEIDRTLSTRQRVQLRFFIERFRREMQEKVRELRGERDFPRRHPPRRGRP